MPFNVKFKGLGQNTFSPTVGVTEIDLDGSDSIFRVVVPPAAFHFSNGSNRYSSGKTCAWTE